MITLYLDETEILNGAFLGYGALFVEDGVPLNAIIDEAFRNLENDSEGLSENNEQDKKTLNLKYFHACEDSKNGHSAICHAINKHFRLANATFHAEILDVDKNKKAKKDELYDLAAFYSSLDISQINEPIKIVFEHRNGLSVKRFENEFTSKYNGLLNNIYDFPYIPATFPKTTFETGNKKVCGLQCCDFLLWASVRNISSNDNTWSERIRSISKFYTKNESKSFFAFDYMFGNGITHGNINYNISNYNKNDEEHLTEKDVLSFFLNAQKYVEFYTSINGNCIPLHLSHLQVDIDEFYIKKESINTLDRIRIVSELYLKLFDTLPLIKGDDSDKEKQSLLLSKRIIALLLRKDLINGVLTINWLAEILEKNNL